MEKDIRSLSDIITKNRRELESVYKVKQAGIGFKRQNGKILRDTTALIFYVRNKPKVNQLRHLNIEPLPKEIEGVASDVVEIPTGFDKRILRIQPTAPGGIQPTAPDDRRYRPFSGGVAIINANPTPSATGTLGLIVRKRSGDTSNDLYGITNSYDGTNEEGVVGLPSSANVGDPWVQPGAHGHGHTPEDTIAYLHEWKKMIPAGQGMNYYDFSLGKIADESINDARPNEVMEIGRVEGTSGFNLGDRVVKRGRTTRKRTGEVTAVALTNIYVAYQGINCLFDDQIEIMGIPETNPFSGPGDAGSVVCSEESPNKVVGLLFGGGEDSEGIDLAIVSPINRIVNDYNLEV
jgi:hypothetical protein